MSAEDRDAPLDSSAEIVRDIYGRVIALEVLVKRLIASHAQRFQGFAAEMLNDIDTMVDSIGNAIEPGYVHDAIKDYLRHYLSWAKAANDSGEIATEYK